MKNRKPDINFIRLVVLFYLLVGFNSAIGAPTCHYQAAESFVSGCCSPGQPGMATHGCDSPCVKGSAIAPMIKPVVRQLRSPAGHEAGTLYTKRLQTRSTMARSAGGSEYTTSHQRIAVLDNLRTVVLRH